MWCKFYFKVHLQRGSWNTNWSEMGFPAVRGLTWRTVVLPHVINTWTIWMWQFHFSTSMSNRCSVNPPMASLCARCSAPSSGWTVAPSCSRDTSYSFIFLYENLQAFPVPTPKAQWPEADTLMCTQQKPQNYPYGPTMGKAHSRENTCNKDERMKKLILLIEFQTIYLSIFL